jgi:anti-sigma-K factor RskA
VSAHDDIKGQAGAYVLGVLEDEERRAFEAHVSACEDCASEVRAFERVSAALGLGVAQRTPPPELRDRVLAAVGGARPAGGASRTPAWSVWLPVAAMLLLTLAMGIHAARLQVRVEGLEARLNTALMRAATAEQLVADSRRVAGELQSAMGVLAAPDLARIDLAGQPAAPSASARALWSRARGMVFTASNLPPLPEGRVYQVWVVAGPAPISAGLLMPDASGGGMVYFNTPPDIPAPRAVAVTLEPAGGLPAPTGAFYLMGAPAAL